MHTTRVITTYLHPANTHDFRQARLINVASGLFRVGSKAVALARIGQQPVLKEVNNGGDLAYWIALQSTSSHASYR